METRTSRVLWNIPLFISVCFVSVPALATYSDDTYVLQLREEDFETGDFNEFPWEQGGDIGWNTTREERYSGSYSANSGAIEGDENTTLRITLDCTSGEITFYRKVSSEPGFDYLEFCIDGVEQGKWSGEEDWAKASFGVQAGTRTFEWTYSKDGSVSDGDDTAWLDDVVFPITSTTIIEAGDLRAAFEHTGQGLILASLFDLATGTEFLGPMPTGYQLLRIGLRNTRSGEKVELRAESGWNLARINSVDGSSRSLIYESPTDSRLTGILVVLPIFVEANSNAIHLELQVQEVPDPWAVEKVAFPQLKLARRGLETRVFIPQGPGRVLEESFNYWGGYPGDSAGMPYFAFYDSQGEAGLYVGTHDPWASKRDIAIGERGEPDGIALRCSYPAPNSDQPANGFEFPGEAVLRLFRGDWYDATLIYRDWVWANAKWYPKLSENGREDTALWMRELPVWIRSFNHQTIEDDLRWAKQFANIVRLPAGLRWYRWSDSPFIAADNPHFFPAKAGFHEAIVELKNHNVPVYVMPFINGSLWDTRDRGLEDFQFTSVALSGCAKNEQGEPITCSFVQEADGSPARHAIMCPASNIWKEKQKELVLRVINELDAKAVYMDCIGGFSPQLCFDHSHGHPTGGGSWWSRSYWKLVEDIRRDIPSDCILTTEGSCEAYVHVYDGLLGYWDYDGAVPAFPAIYGGAIQVFGHYYDYTPRPTLTIAHCMQAGQGFVFGDQTGSYLRLPYVLSQPEALDFINQIIHLRWELRRFFYAGRMMRPPKLYGSIPKVTADCREKLEPDLPNWVTTDAVLTGAWKIPHENRLALLFVNVSDEPIAAVLDLNAESYELPSDRLIGTVVISPIAKSVSWGRFKPPANPGEPSPIPSPFQVLLPFPPRCAWAWIIEPQ